MKFFSATLLLILGNCVMVTHAEPVCEFNNPGQRLISGTDPDDFRCIRLRAAAGDEYWQYYLGLILSGQVAGPENPSEGLAILQQVVWRKNKYSVDAMRFIARLYMRTDTPLHNDELAYQWLYLVSRDPRFNGNTLIWPNQTLNTAITAKRRQELERSAPALLQVH